MTLSEAAKKRWKSPEYRKHMSDAHKGQFIPQDIRNRISLKLKGIKKPKEFSN